MLADHRDPRVKLLADLRPVLDRKLTAALRATARGPHPDADAIRRHMDDAISDLRKYQRAFDPPHQQGSTSLSALRSHARPQDTATELAERCGSTTTFSISDDVDAWPLIVQSLANHLLRTTVGWAYTSHTTSLDVSIWQSSPQVARFDAEGSDGGSSAPSDLVRLSERFAMLGGCLEHSGDAVGWRLSGEAPLLRGRAS